MSKKRAPKQPVFDEATDALQAAVSDWVDTFANPKKRPDKDGRQGRAAKALGISQAQLSRFLSSGDGGLAVWRALATQFPAEVAVAFGMPPAPTGEPPETLRKLIGLRPEAWGPRALAYAKALGGLWSVDRLGDPMTGWTREIEAFRDAHRAADAARTSTPDSSGVRAKTPSDEADEGDTAAR